MKLCPQCEFIYEDEQSFCDMDGTGLVHNPASEPLISRLTIPLVADSGSTARRSSNSIAVATLVVIVLAGLVVAAYFARTRQTVARRSPEPAQTSQPATDQPTPSSAPSTADQPSSATSNAEEAAASQASEQSIASTAAASDQPDVDSTSLTARSSKTALAHSRLNAGPVSASSGTANGRGPVVVRLTNGAAIRADEAWEKSEGVWYRQGGMVTFLKRGRVRSIERVATSPRPQSAAGNTAATSGANQSAKQPVTRDQLRIAKLEPVKPKKDNRVTSFLKKTGNLIKKPFRF